jgi:tellurium resistance protein TerZ
MAIRLEKGQKIDLTKPSGSTLKKFCVGVNWGAIETTAKGFLRNKVTKTEVDLDLSCIMLFSDKNRWDHLYSPLYDPISLEKLGLPRGKLVSVDGALRHSGDDLTGDMDGDDGLDNEIISVDLTQVDPEIDQIFFFINNVGNEDFSQIPFAKIRMYEGTPERVDQVHAEFDVVSNPTYRGKKAMIMGKLYRRGDQWKFAAIGDATDDGHFAASIANIFKNYA